jgi:hypothetical protein
MTHEDYVILGITLVILLLVTLPAFLGVAYMAYRYHLRAWE